MKNLIPQNPDYKKRVQDDFDKQAIMSVIHAQLEEIEAGFVCIKMPFDEKLTQQNGFLHAGIVTTVMDTACGFAALTLMQADAGVLSVEFKVNLLRPAIGERFRAEGKIIKAGRTITVCNGDLYAYKGDEQKLVATMTATMFTR